MANDLKAVVEITADTSGLIKGIDGATKKISEGTSSMAELAKFETLRKSFEMVKHGFEMVGRHYEELYKTAIEYSPAAAAANMNLEMTKVHADMLTAAAVAPGAVGMANLQAQAAAATAQRNLRGADEINSGMIGFQAVKSNYATEVDMLTEAIGNVASGNFGSAFHALGGMFNAQNYVYASDAAPARGMQGWDQSQRAEEHLRDIRDQLKGQ